jgi:hypothetical protein
MIKHLTPARAIAGVVYFSATIDVSTTYNSQVLKVH